MIFKNLSLIFLAGGLMFGAWLFWSTSNDQSSSQRAYESAGDE